MKRKSGGLAQGGVDKLCQMLECPLCFNVMTAAIYQCNNGHLICEACKEKAQLENGSCKCQTCGQAIGNTRNRALEELSTVVKLPCAFHSRGCRVEVFAHERAHHQSTCPMRSVECCLNYFKPDSTSSGCLWKGHITDLSSHLLKIHSFRSRPVCLNQNVRVKFVLHVPPPSISFAYTVLKAEFGPASTQPTQELSPRWPDVPQTPEPSSVSCLQVRARYPDGTLKVFLRALSSESEKEEYWYRLGVRCAESVITTEHKLVPYTVASDWELKTDQCLILTSRQLEMFALPSETHHGESKLELCCQIIKTAPLSVSFAPCLPLPPLSPTITMGGGGTMSTPFTPAPSGSRPHPTPLVSAQDPYELPPSLEDPNETHAL